MSFLQGSNLNDGRFRWSCTEIIKSKIFLGNYTEKRYVARLRTSRDLVVLNDAEEDFRTSLNALIEAIIEHNKSEGEAFWFGYTNYGRPRVACLFTELSDLSFGHYWFQVKSLQFRNIDNRVLEIWVKLEALRPVAISDCQVANKRTYFNKKVKKYNRKKTNTWSKLWEQWKTVVISALLWILMQLNAKNIAYFWTTLNETGLKTIRFIQHFVISFWIVAEPFLMRVLELFAKMVGYLYILITTIWGNFVGPPNAGKRQQPQILAPSRRDTGVLN